MKSHPSTLLRPDIAAMESYTPIVPFDVLSAQLGFPPEQIIKLDANENPYGPSPKVHEALAREPYYHIYPDPGSTALRHTLARHFDLDPEQLMIGHGADELLDVIMRLFLEPGDVVLTCPPTFGMYRFLSQVNSGYLVQIPRQADFTLDIPAVEQKAHLERRAKLLFITSPNNPNGSVISDDDLKRLLDLPLIVVLDEAYVAFANQPSRMAWSEKYDNLIVLGTFSKWAGLAGLRVGYGTFPAYLMPHLWKIKQPYNVNVAGLTAALASLDDMAYLQENVNKIIAERGRLYEALMQIPYLKPYPSQSNFILCRVVERDAYQLKRNLERQGILVRYYSSAGLSDHIRISVGRPEQSDRVIAALQAL